MQFLKEEIRQGIIDNGFNEFYENGFEGASIRRIVEKSGTTIGNFYNYFESKEELFYTITKPVYDSLIAFISSHNENDVNDLGDIQALQRDEVKYKISRIIRKYSYAFDKRLVVLLEGSKGTKYQDIKNKIVLYLAEHFDEHLAVLYRNTGKELNKAFSKIVATGFLEGIVEIVKTYNSNKEKEDMLIEYVMYNIFGFLGFK